MKKSFSLDSIKMHVVSTAEKGEVNTETIFEFTQEDLIVSARYKGGTIRLGYLVGTIIEKELQFRYTQVDKSGHLDSGYSTCEIHQNTDGKIKLIEHFKWDSREGSGTNIFEEID